MSVIHVTTDQEYFDLKQNFAPPFVVDFYADWCGPCKMVAPVFEEISEKVEATFVKVNVETCSIANNYGIRNIPTIIILADFEQAPIKTIIGSKPPSELEKQINEAVGSIKNGN